MSGFVQSGRFSAFAPTDISTLFAWWDSSDTTTYTNSGNPNYYVDSWVDKKGAMTATAVSSNPQGTTASTDQNGLKTILWSSDRMDAGTAANWSFLHKAGGYTIFAVLKMTSTTGNRTLLGTLPGGDYAKPYLDILSASGGSTLRHYVQVNSSTFVCNNSVTLSNNTYYVIAIRADLGNATAANRSEIYVAGGTPTKGNAQTATPSTADTNGALHLGDRGDSLKWIGYFNEAAFFTAKLSDADTNAMGSYLAAKWGLTWTAI